MNKQIYLSGICSVLSLGFPIMHFVLFKCLFTQKVLEIYGSLDALRTGDGWKGYMISEDIEPGWVDALVQYKPV